MAKIHHVSFFAIDRSDNTKKKYKRTEFKSMIADFFFRVKIHGFSQESKPISEEDMKWIQDNPASAYAYCANMFDDSGTSKKFAKQDRKVTRGEIYYHIKSETEQEYVQVLAVATDIQNENKVSVVYEVYKGKDAGSVYSVPYDRFIAPLDDSINEYNYEYLLCGDF